MSRNRKRVAAYRADIIRLCQANDDQGLDSLLLYLSSVTRPGDFLHYWVDFLDDKKYNPLLTAIHNQAHAVTNLLVRRAGAAYCQKGLGHPCGSSALHVAAYSRNLVALHAVLARASAEGRLAEVLGERDAWNKTPEDHAAHHGFEEGLRALRDAALPRPPPPLPPASGE